MTDITRAEVEKLLVEIAELSKGYSPEEVMLIHAKTLAMFMREKLNWLEALR